MGTLRDGAGIRNGSHARRRITGGSRRSATGGGAIHRWHHRGPGRVKHQSDGIQIRFDTGVGAGRCRAGNQAVCAGARRADCQHWQHQHEHSGVAQACCAHQRDLQRRPQGGGCGGDPRHQYTGGNRLLSASHRQTRQASGGGRFTASGDGDQRGWPAEFAECHPGGWRTRVAR